MSSAASAVVGVGLNYLLAYSGLRSHRGLHADKGRDPSEVGCGTAQEPTGQEIEEGEALQRQRNHPKNPEGQSEESQKGKARSARSRACSRASTAQGGEGFGREFVPLATTVTPRGLVAPWRVPLIPS